MPLPVNITTLTNTSAKLFFAISNFHNIPSFAALILTALILLILFKIGLLAADSIISFLSRFLVPIVLFGTAYLMAIFYYLPTYAPNTFVTSVYNESLNKTIVVPNKTIIDDLSSSNNMILLPAFYDKLLFYQSIYKRPIDEVLVSFVILALIFIYLTHFIFWKYLDIYSIILTSMLFFILTLGAKGIILALVSYDLLKYLLAIYLSIYAIIVLFKLQSAK